MLPNFSFELFGFNEALTPYGTIETHPPQEDILTIDDFRTGEHFRTAAEEGSNNLILATDNKLLNIILDESGSNTWNDQYGDRYTYLKRLLNKLDATYPGELSGNLIGFGGSPTKTSIFITKSNANVLAPGSSGFAGFLSEVFQDSVYDFAGVRVVRRFDRFPSNPSDGIVVLSNDIVEAIKDENLTEGVTIYYGIWTMNKDHHFSNGQFIAVTPRERILPKGVNFATSTARVLTGAYRDQFTQLIYNFVEEGGRIVFDSSGKYRHGVLGSQVIEENFWLGDAASSSYEINGELKQQAGVRFDGEFDILETAIDSVSFTPQNINGFVNPVTISFWIYRYNQPSEEWLMGTSTSAPSDNVGWAVTMDENHLFFYTGDLSAPKATFNVTIPEKTWTMITFVISNNIPSFNQINLFINGVSVAGFSGSLISVTNTDMFYIGAKPAEFQSGGSGGVFGGGGVVTSPPVPESEGVAVMSIPWNGTDFFGSLAQISIHSLNRDEAYITDLYNREYNIFFQSIQHESDNPTDNKQREVLITWEVGEDYNYAGGTVKILRKYNSVPINDADGDVVVTQSAQVGQFFYLDSFDFINGGNYYYRIFTYNALGNACDRDDARIAPVYIPLSINEPPDVPLGIVLNESATNGDGKVYLQWTNPIDDRYRGTLLLYGPDRYPSITVSSTNQITITDGFILADTLGENFVHRTVGNDDACSRMSLENNHIYYYSIYTYDQYGRYSDPVNLTGMPSGDYSVVFQPAEISDLHYEIINSSTVSIMWQNPVVKSNQVKLWMDEQAVVFVSIKDLYGGDLTDLSNLKLVFKNLITQRGITTSEAPLGISQPSQNPGGNLTYQLGDCNHGVDFKESTDPNELSEIVLTYAVVQDGLIQGIFAPTTNQAILLRRLKYDLSIRAQYKVQNSENPDADPLFEFNTTVVSASFRHPLDISILNKLNKFVAVPCSLQDKIRGTRPCSAEGVNCDDPAQGQHSCETTSENGGYTKATRPYVARVELQYKEGALPEGTPVTVQLFEHTDDYALRDKSTRTTIAEGLYRTSVVEVEDVDSHGNPTGRIISKSVVDVEIQHPQLPDWVDLYVTATYSGFSIDAVHTMRFIDSLFIRVDGHKPAPDGIDVAEQFATIWQINPDLPEETIPAPDGTLVKWELIKVDEGRDRPFYSTDPVGQHLSGVYSTTHGGIARQVFFGPVGNIERHVRTVTICDIPEQCCVGEVYELKVSTILDGTTATDAMYISFGCGINPDTFTNKRFLMNVDPEWPHTGGSAPHWVTWADGEHLLKFQIARESATSLIFGADCFRACIEQVVGGQSIPLPVGHIVQISAAAEVLWNVSFEVDPYTDTYTPISYNSAQPKFDENGKMIENALANIPIVGETTDFYLRLNQFVGSNSPKQAECNSDGGGGGMGGSGEQDPCRWENICSTACGGGGGGFVTEGYYWDNVSVLSGQSTLLGQNISITLFGGGTYTNGMPPIYTGFKEPLEVRVLQARVNGAIADELVVGNGAIHTFVVEILFAGKPVPDGTVVELRVEQDSGDPVIRLSNCAGVLENCDAVVGGIIFTRQVNDILINPTGNKRSLAYFSIDPLPDVAFHGKINVTCRYDKLNQAQRDVTRCIELNNTVNVQAPPEPPPFGGGTGEAKETSISTNEMIIYDTISDTYTKTKSGKIKRIAPFAQMARQSVFHSGGPAVGDFIYVFGGYTGNQLTDAVEKFNLSTQDWTTIGNMPSQRSSGMTVMVGDYVYCIGGLELDNMTNQFAVSGKIESFNIHTERWNSLLEPMPDNYGVAYGFAFAFNNYIYVTNGLNSVSQGSQPDKLNDKILRYSISDNSWDLITPSDSSLYERISPFAFLRETTDSHNSRICYIYAGSIPKPREVVQAERQNRINKLLNEFRSFILTSTYFMNLTKSEQDSFISSKETEIMNGVVVSPFYYPTTGFKIYPGTEYLNNNELFMDISDTIDDEWKVLPKARDRGQAVYISSQDVAYFIGGSNQNQSTTLNRVEAIDLAHNNAYARLTAMNRGRCLFAAVPVDHEIYLIGGLTSGHRPGYVRVDMLQLPDYVEALGKQSSGILVQLYNDSGEIVENDIRCYVRGQIRIPELDSSLVQFLSNRAANRALGGNGVGPIPDLPTGGETIDLQRLATAENNILDPNSDEFQINAANQAKNQLYLFPVLYSSNEFIIKNGVGSITLLPRSEDPLEDFVKLSQFIQEQLAATPPDPNERFDGNLTREELAALGDALATVKIPPTVVTAGLRRDLYQVETTITLIDNYFFGQTVSDFDLNFQQQVRDTIQALLTPPPPSGEGSGGSGGGESGGGGVGQSPCFLLEHLAENTIPPPPPPPPPQQGGGQEPQSGGVGQSGQELWSSTLLPLQPDRSSQSLSPTATFYNVVEWVPQIKQRLVEGNSLQEIVAELEKIDHEIPFGGSQLYDAIFTASRIAEGETFDDLKKIMYITSDNSQNLSLSTLRQTIDEVNSIDGEGKCPIIYTLFSTSFPVSLAAQLQRTDVGDIERLTQSTGGQSVTLIASRFLDGILNLTLQASGGLGFGYYTRTLTFDELTSITAITTNFILPANTNGYFRFRSSEDGYNFGDWSSKYIGSQFIDIADIFSLKLEIEVTLTTGFSTDTSEEYDIVPTGIPKMVSIIFNTSNERDDYIFVNEEDALSNVQQIAAAFDGTLPKNAIVEIGLATSNSHNWNDFQTVQRPSLREFGKMLTIDRSQHPASIVPDEGLTTDDYTLYKAFYGAWDPLSIVELYYTDPHQPEQRMFTGFSINAREGSIYFDEKQPSDRMFRITITDDNEVRLGVRLRNRLHNDYITVSGVGYIYTTNKDKLPELTQVAPMARKPFITPENPNASDSFMANYQYVDLNNDKETGTIVSWFKNGKQLFEIQNKITWTNSDLYSNNRLTPNDKLYFIVTPSDGMNFGAPVTSPSVTIQAQPPGAENVRLTPYRNSLPNNRYDTGSTLLLQYDFVNFDQGGSTIEDGTIIKWFVNNILFKEATFSSSGQYTDQDQFFKSTGPTGPSGPSKPFNPKKLHPQEVSGGVSWAQIGNNVYVELTPKTPLITGDTVTTSTVVIVNSIGIASNVQVQPLHPTVRSTLLLTYALDDPDILKGNQTNQAEIKWWVTLNGKDYASLPALDNKTNVTPSYLQAGQAWYCEVQPFDGLDLGAVVRSNTVNISP